MPVLYPLLRRMLFRLPAEEAHDVVIRTMARLPHPLRERIRRSTTVDDECLRTTVCDIDFPNPVGLAAGFDKSGRAYNALGALGFGFVEIGTITALRQAGNPKPRVFRLSEDGALLNRMGFNNPGAETVALRLRRSPVETILGINVGKSKVTPLEESVDDYLRSIALLEPFAHYLVINVSSPNTPGLRRLQDAEPLRELLRAVVGRPRAVTNRSSLPVFVKLAPDLGEGQIEQAVGIAVEEGIQGIVAVNTTTSRVGLRTDAARLARLGDGGISGRPLRDRAEAAVRLIHGATGGTIPIIGVGGIFDVDDAWRRILAGASLLQLYTGFVYEGPGLAARINRGLAERVRRSGARSIAEVVGTGRDEGG